MSERQIEANKQNAQLSTGPRTADGKARVASNALKHGLTGKQVVLPNESAEDFDAFRAGQLNALHPLGGLEETLAERIVFDAWRLRRVALLESALYRRGHHESIMESQQREVRRYETTEERRLMATGFAWDKTEVTDVKAHAEALAKVQETWSKLDDPSVKVTMVFEKYAATLANLSRYEAALSRSFWRNLHELQRLQALRAGEQVAAPAVVDINIEMDGAMNPEAILQNKAI
jgi:hypothetical protein